MERAVNYFKWATRDVEPDERVGGWLFMASPWAMLVVVIAYLGVSFAGPRCMKDRSPVDVTLFMKGYNLTLALVSAYMAREYWETSIMQPGFNLLCQGVDRSSRPEALRLASAVWVYLMTKFIELLDTIFMILRKKDKQMTFLHIYHHSTMIIFCWVQTKFSPGGSVFLPNMMNCVVHTFMYSYYFLAACGPRVRPYLGWKKWLTSMQIVQFILVLTFVVVSPFIKECDFPYSLRILCFVYITTHLVLFLNFYQKSYMERHGSGKPGTKATIQAQSNGQLKRE